MTLELIAFVASILFGILWYWRESNGNKTYRFINKILNSKELQMKPNDRTGFVYKQKFLLRLVFISFFFLIIILILKFLIPIDYATVSMFASSIVGTMTGTYLATLVFKSRDILSENSEIVEDKLNETLDKGKEFIEDILDDDKTETNEKPLKEEKTKENEESARDRLKKKGLL